MSRKYWFLVLFLVIVLAVVVSIGVLDSSKSKVTSGTIKTIKLQPDTKSSKNSASNTATTTPSGSQKTSSVDAPSTDSNLVAPYGSLVSNHKPGQNGSNLIELSQCTTTSGATCYIKFTQGSVVKMLPSQTTDSSGTTSWEWKISDAGLTSGQWTVIAVATLNGQTKTTADQLTLEIQ